MRIKNLLLLTILFSISSFSWSQFTMMKVEGLKQGKFKSESTKAGSTDKTEVLGYAMEIKSPRDVASGQATGKRQHIPLTIWKIAGSSSPQFFQALVNNETLKTVTIEFYKPDDVFTSSKTEQLSYKIELTNAYVTSYRQVMGSAAMEGFKSIPALIYDEIKFVYEKITVTSVNGNASASDDWNSTNR